MTTKPSPCALFLSSVGALRLFETWHEKGLLVLGYAPYIHYQEPRDIQVLDRIHAYIILRSYRRFSSPYLGRISNFVALQT
jgi:hypothetical protein